jgi:hypothetical protein
MKGASGYRAMLRILITSLFLGLFGIMAPNNTTVTPLEAGMDSSSGDLTRMGNNGSWSPSLVYSSRNAFLTRAAYQWKQLGNDLEGMTLYDASSHGLLPFWLVDPNTANPVRILNEGSPSGSDVVLKPELGGLGCTMIHRDQVGKANVDPIVVDNISWFEEGLSGVPIEDQIALELRRAEFPPTNWGIMMDGFIYNVQEIFLPYLIKYENLPSSLEELLDNTYFLNQGFIDYAQSLISSGQSAYFEFGIMPEEHALYFDFEPMEGMWVPFMVQYQFTESGDMVPRSADQQLYPNGVPEEAYRIIFLSDQMLSDPEQKIDSELIRPLSDFYITE